MVNDYNRYAVTRQTEILHGGKPSHQYIEKPMMQEMLPDLTGKKVLMLGCGTGEESRIIAAKGATKLVGIDISEASIKIAKESYPEYEFIVADMHKLPFKDHSFDFVYSSLAIHYSANPDVVYKEVFRVLKRGGKFLFSLGHPLRWASTSTIINNSMTKIIGYTEDEGELKLYGTYSSFTPHKHFFSNDEILEFYVGPPSMHFKLLKTTGFRVEDFTESKCAIEVKDFDTKYYERCAEMPQFMAFLSKK